MIFTGRRSRRDHTWAQENLSAYLDGELPLAHKARMERHLAECAECRQSLHTLRQTVALLRRVPAVQPPVSFILPPSAQRRQARYRQWQMGFSALRAAAVAVSVMLAVLLSADALLTSGIVTLPARPVERLAAPVAQESGYSAQEPMGVAPHEAPTLAPSMTPPPTAAALALAQSAMTPTPEALDAQAPTMRKAAPQETALPTPTGMPPTLGPDTPVFTELTPPSAPAVAAFPSAQGGPGMGGAGGSGGGAEGGGGGAAEGAPALAAEPAELKAPPPFEPSTLQRGPVPTLSLEPTNTPTESASVAIAFSPTETPSAPAQGPTPSLEITPSPTPAEVAFALQPTLSKAEPQASIPEEPRVSATVPWALWRAIRLGALGLAGVLLMLLGGLLWLGQKRRV